VAQVVECFSNKYETKFKPPYHQKQQTKPREKGVSKINGADDIIKYYKDNE
jgi:hypothetical protein